MTGHRTMALSRRTNCLSKVAFLPSHGLATTFFLVNNFTVVEADENLGLFDNNKVAGLI